MGQESYLIRTGVGFDVDRASGKEAIGFIETMAETMNTKAMVKSVNGIKERNQKLIDLNKDLEKKLDNETQKRKDKVEQAAKATHQSIMETVGREPRTKKYKGKTTERYQEYLDKVNKMSTAHKKFADRAAAAGIKIKRSMTTESGKEIGVDSQKFAKQGAENRQRQINLMKQMQDENRKLLEQDKTASKANKLKAEEIKEIEDAQEVYGDEVKRLIALDKDAIAVERKEAKNRKKHIKQYKKDAAEQHRLNKRELQNIKHRTKMYQEMGRKAASAVRGITSGMKNAFVIGTAAAAAFAYKLQPVVEQVMEFEKTIINANSVFRESNEVLHEVSDSLVQFGLQYGISTEKSAEGLYQLASAGLSAAESQEVLQHTLKLSMATQGDHNTLAKLTVQTIMGFGMEMDQAGELTDKFAHTIQKSLVEWQDLASSVKFAMPFFVATGQSIDSLLGGIEVLSNRALEAGIAGRGLRQSLAQLTKHAEDNESQFAKLGVQTMDNQGNMRELTDIVNDAKQAFGDVTDLQALTAMLEDMNVRGATAFALLVQNADEYEAAVKDLANSAGEATAMADVQQESLAMQIQKVKNALMAPFLFSDKIGEANGTLNVFTLRIKEIVDEFVSFFIVGEKGAETVTKFGYQIRDFVVAVMTELLEVVRRLKDVFLEQEAGLDSFQNLLFLATKPMMIMLDVLDKMGPHLLNWIVYYKVMAKVLPLNTLMSMANTRAMLALAIATGKANSQKLTMTGLLFGETVARWKNSAAMTYETAVIAAENAVSQGQNITMGQKILLLYSQAAAWVANNAAMLGAIGLAVLVGAAIIKIFKPMQALALILFGAAAAWIAFHAASTLGVSGAIAIGAVAAGLAALAAYAAGWGVKGDFNSGAAMQSAATTENSDIRGRANMRQLHQGVGGMDTGGRFNPAYYDTGGLTDEHGMAVLQKGETVISRSQNMVGGSEAYGGGPSIIIQGDIYDADKFTEKIAQVLPGALRNSNDIGAI